MTANCRAAPTHAATIGQEGIDPPSPRRGALLPRGIPLWQRNYWDRVIRDNAEHERIAKYIRDNPANWKGDRFNR